MATRIGIMATIGMDGRGFHAGLLSAERGLARFGRRLAGFFSVAAMTAAMRRTIEWADATSDLSKQLGITVTELQELEYAAKQTGATTEDLAAAFKEMSKFRSEVLKDPKSQSAKLAKALGLSKEELAKTTEPIKLFERLAEIIRTTNLGAARGDIMSQIFGRGGISLINMMTEGLAKLREEAHKNKTIMPPETVEQLSQIADKIEEIKQRLTISLGPAIVWVADRIADLANNFVMAFKVISKVATAVSSPKVKEGIAAQYIASWMEMGMGADPKHMGIDDKIIRLWKVHKNFATNLFKTAAPALEEILADVGEEGSKVIPHLNAPAPAGGIPNVLGNAWMKTAGTFKPSTDELARIGGFIGGTGTAVSIAREQLTETKALRREVVKISGFATSQF